MFLKIAKRKKVARFIYASTSSIYGIQKKYPLKEKFETNNQFNFMLQQKLMRQLQLHIAIFII